MNLVIATRLHLANASAPPADEKYGHMMGKFCEFSSSCKAQHTYVAVDAEHKFDDYDLVETIKRFSASSSMKIIPVTPWGKFVTALNSIIISASKAGATHCLFCSAETNASSESISVLMEHMDEDTLVVGAVLPGHNYHPKSKQALNGRTTPWNTLAIWSLEKLALTGFPLVGDGIHNLDGVRVDGGVEEVSTIALLQALLGVQHAKAKLVPVPTITWEQNFDDEERQKWHEAKMKSKIDRPAKHLKLLKLDKGEVEHF
mmetsp:Transcript_27833/g.31813  ORF Transcript_27833/g.31813 Transcript_27833/m.31813 type:complete len:259 (-) Transcript_27833:305-1081(-)|eukprot:CAMPEP_0194130988 /NCGR_PEP_ID=MMETSP0152-20130528/1858_1 /TAXON_ID=1049557 /ORGANISM="Thalassiothrix antarctica, Strain L6-D1" /LENGTH=258 /DNA_ID=CAMNT_0038825635 /DNA_START=106 /DNA_END=882 /DNA_ORIENTATION=-